MSTEASCGSCSRVRRLASKGLCWTCYKKTLVRPCSSCGHEKPIVSKGRCGSCARAERRGACSGCGTEARLWPGGRCWGCYHWDPDVNARHKASIRRSNLQKFYGLTPEQYDAMLEEQGHACAICRRPAEGYSRNFSVDHDHACCPGAKSCGACVRGLLCQDCNNLLGQAKEDVEVLESAISYLKRGIIRP